MIHCKLLVVDGTWVSVGSANFDNRSIRLNDEANMNILDAGFAAQQTAIFQRDKSVCREVKLDENNHRVLMNAPAGAVSNVMASQL